MNQKELLEMKLHEEVTISSTRDGRVCTGVGVMRVLGGLMYQRHIISDEGIAVTSCFVPEPANHFPDATKKHDHIADTGKIVDICEICERKVDQVKINILIKDDETGYRPSVCRDCFAAWYNGSKQIKKEVWDKYGQFGGAAQGIDHVADIRKVMPDDIKAEGAIETRDVFQGIRENLTTDHFVEANNMVLDDPETDATDFAHPAWWRGYEAAVKGICQRINDILDGKGVSGVSSDPWESTRRRLAELVATHKKSSAVEDTWHPMSEAPDKRDVLIAYDSGTIEKLILFGNKWHQSCCHEFIVTPKGQIGWMPLPAPPTCKESLQVQNECEEV